MRNKDFSKKIYICLIDDLCVFWYSCTKWPLLRCNVLQKRWRTLNNSVPVMRRINKCVHEYSEISFISLQLQKLLENIATACTICCAAATFFPGTHRPFCPPLASSRPQNFSSMSGCWRACIFANLMTHSEVCQVLPSRRNLRWIESIMSLNSFWETVSSGGSLQVPGKGLSWVSVRVFVCVTAHQHWIYCRMYLGRMNSQQVRPRRK